jgi:hypothetical protein
VKSRKDFYDGLADTKIKIDGIDTVERDTAFDSDPPNFMRHYYDAYSLLDRSEVQAFIGTDDYTAHKNWRFRSRDNKNIAKNEAFILSDPETRKTYAATYAKTSALYYGDKPTFEQILETIGSYIARL